MIDYEKILTDIVKRRNEDPTLMKKFFLKKVEEQEYLMVYFGTNEKDCFITKQYINKDITLDLAKARAYEWIINKILDKLHDDIKTLNF